MQKYYFDSAATTKVREDILKAMLPYFDEDYGNPSSIHSFGQEAHLGLNSARKTIAQHLGANISEIVFTSGATESSTTIIQGYARKNKLKGTHIVTTAFEHSSVINACKQLEEEGFKVTYIQPSDDGLISIEDVANAITDETILVSTMYVNNELGTIQPIQEIGELLKDKDILFHTDAVQAVQYLPCNVSDLHIDALSLTGHKFHAPKGIGIMYLNSQYEIQPLLDGNQEFGMRAGTQNVPYAVAFGKALEDAITERDKNKKHVQELKDHAVAKISKLIADVKFNGSLEKSTPHILNVCFPGAVAESLVIRMDLDGIAISQGSACSAEDKAPSHVLTSIGLTREEALCSIRISFNSDNTIEEVDYLTERLAAHVGELRLTNITY